MMSPSGQWLTLGFLAALTVVAIGFDVAVISRYGPDASISRVLSRLVGRWPSFGLALVFWLGVLVGHVYLPAR